MFAGRWVAVVTIACLTGWTAWKTGLIGIAGIDTVLPPLAKVTCGVLLFLVWALMIAVLIGRRRSEGVSTRMRLLVLTASCALFGAFILVLAVGSPTLGGLWLFPLSVHSLMGDVSLLAIPLLQIAAVDFAEWGRLGGWRLAGIGEAPVRHQARRWSLLVPTVLCAVLVVVDFTGLLGTLLQRMTLIGEGLLILVVGCVIVLAAGRLARVRGSRWPSSISVAVLFVVLAVTSSGGAAVTAGLSGALTAPVPSAVSAQGDYTAAANVYSYTGASGFTVLIPRAWLTSRAGHLDVVHSSFPQGTTTVLVSVAVTPATSASAAAAHLQARPQGAADHDGPWMRLAVAPSGGGVGTIWVRPLPGPAGSLIFYGSATGRDPAPQLHALEAIVRSYAPADTPAATLKSLVGTAHPAPSAAAQAQRQDDLVQTIAIGFDLFVAGIGYVLLLIFGRR